MSQSIEKEPTTVVAHTTIVGPSRKDVLQTLTLLEDRPVTGRDNVMQRSASAMLISKALEIEAQQ